MDLGLDRKLAFIAGSSRGIGLAIARGFLREGARVIITGRDADALELAAASLADLAGPESVLAIQGDLTIESEIERSFAAATAQFGPVDAVIANIGSGQAPAGFAISEHEWNSVLDLNLMGGMLLAKVALANLVDHGRGSLTFISSIAGCEAINAPVPYGAAKAAVLSAMKSLSRLVGPKGVRVNAVAPGNTIFPGGAWERKLAERRDFFEQYIQTEVPLQRFASPDEIADAVVFLSSDRASFITGACLVVDGGQTRSI
jgi:3-oxoacyl-[acyl-carrier protein] reductase